MNIKTQDSTYCTNGRPSIYFIVFGPSFREDMFRGSWWCSGAVVRFLNCLVKKCEFQNLLIKFS